MRAVAIRRVLALTAGTPNDTTRLIKDNLDWRRVSAAVRSIAVWIQLALVAPTPCVLACTALINERALDDASGRLSTRVGHLLVLQPPGGLSNHESRPKWDSSE